MTTKSSKFMEYMNIHLISLNQDMESHSNNETKIHLDGQIVATRHLLSVATDIMNSSNERVYE
jgi:hypothetical protein